MLELTTVVLVIAGLLIVIGALQPLAERLKIPASVLLAGVGVAIGVLASFLLYTPLTDRFNQIVEPIVNLPLRSSTFIYIFLPLLLFQAALTIDVARMKQDAAPILLLAVIAVFVTTVVIGVSVSWLFEASLVACLLLGSVVATTDPAAVVGIFRDIGAPPRLTRLVEGESLLNDAAAIALFSLLLDMLVRGATLDPAAGGMTFAVNFTGGLVVGVVAGKLLMFAIRWLANLKAAETTLTMAAPYVVFIVCDQFLAVSGVVAVVTLGLCVSAWGKSTFMPENWQYLHNVWDQVAFWAGSLVFILASIMVPRLIPEVSGIDVLIILTAVVAAFVARALVLFGLLPVLSFARLTRPVGWEYKTAILWGGLRGAVTLALALSVVENPALNAETKRLVAVSATGFVLFTLFVNGTTLRMVVRKLKLDVLTPRDEMLRDHILALSFAGVGNAVLEAGERYQIPSPDLQPVLDQYETRMTEVVARGAIDTEHPLRDSERLAIALVALANRERELILRYHGQQGTSPAVVDKLLRHAERIVEGAQADGRIGYRRAARAVLAFRPVFRIAHFLHRNLRIDIFLSTQLARRFEMEQALGLVLAELQRFNETRVKPIFGSRIAELTGKIIDERVLATSEALDAMRLQYPAFAEALTQRFICRFASQEELDRYDTLRREGLLGREVHDHLVRDVHSLRQKHEKRPHLDLGLKIPDMIGQVELFSGLSPRELKKISRLVRSRLAVPGEYIVRKGEQGDRVFFISSGAVEVRLLGQAIRLGRGEFFGELALLAGRRRVADIVALSYCELLTLDKAKLDKFLRVNPNIKAQVEGVAKERMENLSTVIEVAQETRLG